MAGGPAGVRVRTWLHLIEDEAAGLGEVGEFLGLVYRREFAYRITLGRIDRKAHGVWRAERERAVTAVASSWWAGAITRAVRRPAPTGDAGLDRRGHRFAGRDRSAGIPVCAAPG